MAMVKGLLHSPVVANYGSLPAPSTNTGDYPAAKSLWSQLLRRYGSTRKCVSSKAALLILLWSFVVGLWSGIVLNPNVYSAWFKYVLKFSPYVGLGFVAFLFLLFPPAGLLADLRLGRYKIVVRSAFSVLLATMAASILIFLTYALGDFDARLIFFSTVMPFIVVSLIGVVGFTANVVQFGIDQLHDSPGEDRTLFIRWYVWTYYLSMFISRFSWGAILYGGIIDVYYKYDRIGISLLGSLFVVSVGVLLVSLCVARRNRRWFLIEPGSLSPYKLVYRVTKFARQHKVPVHRSAFAYCEDEVPTGLDLAKDKYGGPFTTGQVEDVKAFYGIIKVLFSFGIAFFLDYAAESLLPVYALHVEVKYYYNSSGSGFGEYAADYNATFIDYMLFNSGLIAPLVTAVGIAFYLCVLRPFCTSSLGMLKRMGLGMLLSLLSLVTLFSIDAAAHWHHDSVACMFSYFSEGFRRYSIDPPSTLSQNIYFLTIPLVLSAFSNMFTYTAVFEFICSQSPHAMKGMFIGVLFAVKGLHQLFASLLIVPFAVNPLKSVRPSCGFYYYLVGIVLGGLGTLVFVCVSRRYRYRERDEHCNIHRYAEEYYSNTQQEEGYDCSYN